MIILHRPIWIFLSCALGTSLFLHLPFGRFVSVSSFIGFSVDSSLLEAIRLDVFHCIRLKSNRLNSSTNLCALGVLFSLLLTRCSCCFCLLPLLYLGLISMASPIRFIDQLVFQGVKVASVGRMEHLAFGIDSSTRMICWCLEFVSVSIH